MYARERISSQRWGILIQFRKYYENAINVAKKTRQNYQSHLKNRLYRNFFMKFAIIERYRCATSNMPQSICNIEQT